MSRLNLKNLLEQAPFDVTVHISLPTIEDLLRNALLHGVVSSTISPKPIVHEPTDDTPGYTEVSVVNLQPPTIALVLDGNQEVMPIPEILVEDENENKVQLKDPDYPDDREEWDMFLRFDMPFSLTTNNARLANFSITTINGNLTALAKPYFSLSSGLGFIRYDFDIELTSSGPINIIGFGLNDQEAELKEALLTSFYPEIIALIPSIVMPFPDLQGLSVQAIKLFTNNDFDLPPTLTIGLGGQGGTDADLLPLLDTTDGMAVSVSKAYFDKQIEDFNTKNDAFNAINTKGSYNSKDKRYEKIRWLKLRLIENAVHIHTKIKIETMSTWDPDALVEVKGPSVMTLFSDKTKSILTADNHDLKTTVDVGFGWDFLRGFADLITLGLAEFYFTPAMSDAENKAGRGVGEQIASQLQSGLLGAFPSRKEILGHNDGIIRESAVILGVPNTMKIHESGLMINGPACGGIIRRDPSFNITAVYRVNNTIKAFAFNNKFWMWKERAIEHWKQGTLRISGVQLIRMSNGTEYLKDRPDRREYDNLLKRPFFNPDTAGLVNGNEQELLGKPEHYLYDENNVLVRLDVP
jgi:hypothetical protein